MSIGDRKAELGDRIQEAMEEAGMNQDSLADAVGAGQSTVNAWLKGRTFPSGQYLIQMPGLFNVSGHWLLTGHQPKRVGREPEALRDAYNTGWREAMASIRRTASDVPAAAGPALPTSGGPSSPAALDAHARASASRSVPGKQGKGTPRRRRKP